LVSATSTDFDRFAEKKTRDAAMARIGWLTTEVAPAPSGVFSAVGNPWTREHYDGDYILLPSPSSLPALSIVFVQSADGNTGAENPATLGGGPTDAHLIYEGLSRVAADAVMAGAATARGQVLFSVWHPALVALRDALALPRHPAQVVLSRDGNLDLAGTLLFNVPAVPVYVIAGARCRDRCGLALSRRPWIHVIDLKHDELAAALGELRNRGVRRISAVGGRSTASALLDAGLVQDVCLTTTSVAGGEPGTPFYVGRQTVALDLMTRKRSTDADDSIRVEHFRVTTPAQSR
jgi:riboflavin biosynthesis pyrimidine reductase